MRNADSPSLPQIGLTYKNNELNKYKLKTPFSLHPNNELIYLRRENERFKEMKKDELLKSSDSITERSYSLKPNKKGKIKKLFQFENISSPDLADLEGKNLFKLTESINSNKLIKSEERMKHRHQQSSKIKSLELSALKKEFQMKKSLEERKRLSYIALNDEKASPREFISNVRSLRYSELAISQKKEEIQKMKEFIKMKEDKLKYNMKKFESDKNFFSSYIQEVKTKEENANKKIEDIEQKIKIISDMNGNLQNEISSMRMLMERNLDNLKKLKSQQEFIFSLCPPNLVKKFKEDRIVKLKSRGISDPTIFNAILTSGEQGITEDSKSKVIEHSKEKEYFNDLHELGFTEVDSDDDFQVLFSNKNEIIEIINQYEERSLKNIITLEENNKLYDTNKQEYNEKINKKMREKLEKQKKLDEIDEC